MCCGGVQIELIRWVNNIILSIFKMCAHMYAVEKRKKHSDEMAKRIIFHFLAAAARQGECPVSWKWSVNKKRHENSWLNDFDLYMRCVMPRNTHHLFVAFQNTFQHIALILSFIIMVDSEMLMRRAASIEIWYFHNVLWTYNETSAKLMQNQSCIYDHWVVYAYSGTPFSDVIHSLLLPTIIIKRIQYILNTYLKIHKFPYSSMLC